MEKLENMLKSGNLQNAIAENEIEELMLASEEQFPVD
jgi:hypothetical protein